MPYSFIFTKGSLRSWLFASLLDLSVGAPIASDAAMLQRPPIASSVVWQVLNDLFTAWKIDMEPTNHQFRKENDLPNLHDYCSSSGVYPTISLAIHPRGWGLAFHKWKGEGGYPT